MSEGAPYSMVICLPQTIVRGCEENKREKEEGRVNGEFFFVILLLYATIFSTICLTIYGFWYILRLRFYQRPLLAPLARQSCWYENLLYSSLSVCLYAAMPGSSGDGHLAMRVGRLTWRCTGLWMRMLPSLSVSSSRLLNCHYMHIVSCLRIYFTLLLLQV